MPRSSFRRYLPDSHTLREHRALRPLRKWLQNPQIWHFHRRAVAGAAFIGLFVSFVPLPAHMLMAAAIAVVTRCNLPLAVGLVWINNPLTMGPIFFFAYKLGAWLLHTRLTVVEGGMSMDWLTERFSEIWRPLVLGSLVCGCVSGLIAYAVVRIAWRIKVVRSWNQRRRIRNASGG